MEQEKKDQRITIMLSESELESVEKWAHENRIKSRGEAMRQLLNAGSRLLPVVAKTRNAYFHSGADSSDFLNNFEGVITAFHVIQNSLGHTQSLEAGAKDQFEMFSGGDTEALLEMVDYALTRDSELTDRQLFVAEKMFEGIDDGAIAELLGISDRTLKSYINMLVDKLGVSSRDEVGELVMTRPGKSVF